MSNLYTKNGRPLQVPGDSAYSRSGEYVGRISGGKIYDPSGHYAGTINGDRGVLCGSRTLRNPLTWSIVAAVRGERVDHGG